jgi:recombination protein RecT
MSKEIAKAEPTMSERFMNKVTAEFTSGVGEIALTDFQKRLAQNYFMAIDTVLKSTEEKRLKKSDKYRDKLPAVWANVNMEQLARNVVAVARIGLDPAQKNHINMIPFKNNTTNKYDIVFVEGYRGIELKAMKYGLNIPDHVIVELVYSTDKFKSIKKDRNNQYESFEFEIVNDFDRGEVVGGFYYHVYTNNPEKNKLVVMSLKDILKRKPEYASPEFWGGEKDKWEDGKKVGKTQVEGWFEEMCYKTVYRAAFNSITIDSQKIDDDYMRLRQMEHSLAEVRVAKEIAENANGEIIDIEPIYSESDQEGQERDDRASSADNPIQQDMFLKPTGTEGPGF